MKTAEIFRNGQSIDTDNVGDNTWGITIAQICKTINNNIHQGRSCSYLRLDISIENYVRQFYLSIWIDEVCEQLYHNVRTVLFRIALKEIKLIATRATLNDLSIRLWNCSNMLCI